VIDRLRLFFTQPIPPAARPKAFALFAALVVAGASLMAIALHHHPAPRASGPAGAPTRAATPPPAGPSQAVASAPVSPAPPGRPAGPDRAGGAPPAAEQSARAFLRGYLAYLYGRANARAIPLASAQVRRALAAHPPRVSPAQRERHPRITALSAQPLASGAISLTATIDDGGVARYPIRVKLARRARSWRVVQLLFND